MGWGPAKESGKSMPTHLSKLLLLLSEPSGTPNHRYFLKSIAGRNGRRAAVQVGGVLQYKLEVYCGVSLFSMLRSQEHTALQMGGVLRYKLEVYCGTC